VNELALFAGAGGGILGGKLLGWRTVCAVEIDSYARRVLLARQADGCLEPFPIWDDVTTFNGNEWRGVVDVVSGGFPCQDISAAGKGAGLDGERSGLWAEMARIIGEVQPAYVWVENSPMLLIRGIDRVLWDLAALGYDARWGIVGACHAGAHHRRERCFVMAYAVQDRRGLLQNDRLVESAARSSAACDNRTYSPSWPPLPAAEFWGGSNGPPEWVDQGWRCLGNGQVPAVVRLAWNTLAGINQT
jgi:DNA (cytosine-5)-methyltransferase 1